MVLDYRFDFKDKLVAKLSELKKRLQKMDSACVNDQQRQAIFKNSLSNLQ